MESFVEKAGNEDWRGGKSIEETLDNAPVNSKNSSLALHSKLRDLVEEQ